MIGQIKENLPDNGSFTDERRLATCALCGMTVSRRFGREVRLVDSVFNPFFDFNSDALKLSVIL